MFIPALFPAVAPPPPEGVPLNSLSRVPVRLARRPSALWKSRCPQTDPDEKASRSLSMMVTLVPSRVARIVRTAGFFFED